MLPEATKATEPPDMAKVSGEPVRATPSALMPNTPSHSSQPDDIGEYERWRSRLTKISDSILQHLPHYLFRVTCNKSQGTNVTGFYQAGAITQGLGFANFYEYSKDEVRQTLRDHVRSVHNLSHWISFTASTPKVIDFALRMKENGKKDIRIHIVNTKKLKNRPLVVHAYSMLQTYQADLNPNLSYDVARLQTSWNEFLVWDELQGDADSIALDELLYPEIPGSNTHRPGLRDLMPNLREALKKGISGRVQKARRFQKYHGFREKTRLYKLAQKSPLCAKDWVGRRGLVKRSNLEFPEDARVPLDQQHLLDYMNLVRNMRKDFQLPMVVALLSMRTDFIDYDSIVEELSRLPKAFPDGDERFKDLSFWTTIRRPDSKVDVQCFEGLYSRACIQIAGEQSVLSGPRHDHRTILRLDADPKVADTTKGRSGPSTMAVALSGDSLVQKESAEQVESQIAAEATH